MNYCLSTSCNWHYFIFLKVTILMYNETHLSPVCFPCSSNNNNTYTYIHSNDNKDWAAKLLQLCEYSSVQKMATAGCKTIVYRWWWCEHLHMPSILVCFKYLIHLAFGFSTLSVNSDVMMRRTAFLTYLCRIVSWYVSSRFLC